MECKFLDKRIHIITEDAYGNLYMLEADNYNELVNDRNGDHCFIPEDDAKVYFASYDGNPINPYAYKDFLSLAKHIRVELC